MDQEPILPGVVRALATAGLYRALGQAEARAKRQFFAKRPLVSTSAEDALADAVFAIVKARREGGDMQALRSLIGAIDYVAFGEQA